MIAIKVIYLVISRLNSLFNWS